jgi:glycosyltransferase involved in cell wall biosynthesis
MNASKVSVLVPTFNRANYISECLDSLFAQSVPALEIIVIDDGSEDGTAALLSGYGERIRYVRKENGGKPSAVNLGLSMVQGDLIWIFDDDDVALPDAIETRLACLKQHPEAGFVYSPHYYGSDGPDGRIQCGQLHKIPHFNDDEFFFELMKGCFFSLSSSLVRARCYREVGEFDTALLSSEDYDMLLRLVALHPFAFSPSPSFIVREHTGLRGAKAIRYTATQRSKVFRRFDQRVGQKLRASLAPGDYLVPRQLGGLSAHAHRLALLNKMTIMASKGCIPEMFNDLRQLLSLPDTGQQLSCADAKQISEAIRTGYAYEACRNDWSEFINYVRELKGFPAGKSAVRALTAGVFAMARGYPDSFSGRLGKLRVALALAVASIR